jgi:chemotaxis protein methyltransferase CheR
MRPQVFELFSTLLKERSGLVVNQDKAYLLESRLMPLARKHGLKGLDELADLVQKCRDDSVINEVTEAMTTNESFFFRDIKPFDLFRATVLPQLLESRAAKKSFRIWCAAASSGQEPYSLAMILNEEAAKLAGWRYEILGTDISTEVLEKAESGLYSQFEVQRGLPIQLLMKYFTKSGDKWKINASLRAKMQFKVFNLLDDLGPLGRFDVVYCRNVLIYFDQPTKSAILEKISRLIPNDGVLFLGGAETVLGISDKFKSMPGQRGIYIPVAAAEDKFKPATPASVAAPTSN